MSESPEQPAVDERIKFMVVASDCPEARLAAFFAARRAKRSNARVLLLHVIAPPEFGHWATVAETMRAEAHEQAEAVLREFSAEAKAQSGEAPEIIIREGEEVDEIRKLIAEDDRISFLVLGAAEGQKGPGPLVSALASRPAYLASRPIPVVVVPGAASREDLRRLSG